MNPVGEAIIAALFILTSVLLSDTLAEFCFCILIGFFSQTINVMQAQRKLKKHANAVSLLIFRVKTTQKLLTSCGERNDLEEVQLKLQAKVDGYEEALAIVEGL